jgi:hypothetical protein
MIALFWLIVAILASPFKSKFWPEAENEALQRPQLGLEGDPCRPWLATSPRRRYGVLWIDKEADRLSAELLELAKGRVASKSHAGISKGHNEKFI